MNSMLEVRVGRGIDTCQQLGVFNRRRLPETGTVLATTLGSREEVGGRTGRRR